VLGLKVRHIVVLGHAQCGGIKAALIGPDPQKAERTFVDNWMNIVAQARSDVLEEPGDNPQEKLELEAIKVSLKNLRSFPFIAELENAGLLKLHGAYFGISDGQLRVLNEGSGEFSVV
jgi:carbonic anhydrase